MKALLALAAFVAALALSVPVAFGAQFTTDTMAPGGYAADTSGFVPDTLAPGGSSVQPDAIARYVHNHPGDIAPSSAYNPQAYVPGGASSTVAGAIQQTGNGKQPVAEQPTVSVPSSGFSWGDAGIGAGVASAGLLALAGGMFLATRRPRRLAV